MDFANKTWRFFVFRKDFITQPVGSWSCKTIFKFSLAKLWLAFQCTYVIRVMEQQPSNRSCVYRQKFTSFSVLNMLFLKKPEIVINGFLECFHFSSFHYGHFDHSCPQLPGHPLQVNFFCQLNQTVWQDTHLCQLFKQLLAAQWEEEHRLQSLFSALPIPVDSSQHWSQSFRNCAKAEILSIIIKQLTLLWS